MPNVNKQDSLNISNEDNNEVCKKESTLKSKL